MSILFETASHLPRLVMIHGLFSSAQEFGMVRHPLRRTGVALEALQVAGYTQPVPPEPSQWQDWMLAAAAQLGEAGASQPVVLGGLCSGAMLAAALALQHPRRVAGLVMLAPVLAFDGWGLPRWYALRKLAYALGLTRLFSMPEREPYGIKNPRVRQWVMQQLRRAGDSVVGPARVPLWAVRQSERLSAHMLPRLGELRMPVLVVHAREDEICSLAAVQRALAAVPPAQHRLVVLEDSYHMVTVDAARGVVVDEIAAFVRQCAAPPIYPLGSA